MGNDIMDEPMTRTLALSRFLGWYSIGLGIAEIFYGRRIGRAIGLEHHTKLLRGFGAREVASGVAILTDPANPGWLWTRVGGDALDLSVMAGALNSRNPERETLAWAIAAVAGVTVLDIFCARDLQDER